ncbi:hypothetical protein Tco_0741473 [Tanacetum coccineum]
MDATTHEYSENGYEKIGLAFLEALDEINELKSFPWNLWLAGNQTPLIQNKKCKDSHHGGCPATQLATAKLKYAQKREGRKESAWSAQSAVINKRAVLELFNSGGCVSDVGGLWWWLWLANGGGGGGGGGGDMLKNHVGK